MFAHNGVILTKAHFFSGIAWVLLCYIKETRVSGAEQFDLDSGWLRHDPFLLVRIEIRCRTTTLPDCCAANAALGGESQ